MPPASTLTPATLAFTEDGVPYSERYGDVYHSADGGPGQARHVFLHGNGLPERWRGRERFTILETGFGCGLNFLATWEAWRDDPAACRRLHYLSVERQPFHSKDLSVIHTRWPEFEPLSAELLAVWPALAPGGHRLQLADGDIELTLLFGDAEEVVAGLDVGIDAFYLDGFSPARNPDIWSAGLLTLLGRLANPEATLATWSVAGSVREGLTKAGFMTEKAAGYGHKKAMLHGRWKG